MIETNILAVDTSTRQCSAAIYTQGEIFNASRVSQKHSSQLIGLVEDVLRQQHLLLADLNLVIVNTGPGSFTGVRTGIGLAQGIAYGLRIPLCGIDSLSILATAANQKGIILPMIDARMKQVYSALYEIDVECKELIPPYVCNPADLLHLDQQQLTVVGDGWQSQQKIFRSMLGDRVEFDESLLYPDATSAINAMIRYGLGKTASPLELAATYVRDNVVHNQSGNQLKSRR